MIETAKTTSLVFIILLGAAMLTAAFRAFGGEELVREFLNSLPGGFCHLLAVRARRQGATPRVPRRACRLARAARPPPRIAAGVSPFSMMPGTVCHSV